MWEVQLKFFCELELSLLTVRDRHGELEFSVGGKGSVL